ncbi:50S ribosomal protein L37Ae [uncultured archaeon]|nr:50S ribosomal protein L37Ae [uncultured archaeon]
MGKTKKVGSTGRFGSRYGVGIRKRLLKIEPRQKNEDRKCPNCGALTVKRISKGVFHCRKCFHEFVGGAYLSQTLTGGIIRQMVSQKKFVPELISQLPKTREELSEGEGAAAEAAEKASGSNEGEVSPDGDK